MFETRGLQKFENNQSFPVGSRQLLFLAGVLKRFRSRCEKILPGIGVIIGFFSICFLKVVVIVCRVPFNGSYIPFRLGFAASLPEGVGYLEEQRQSKKHSSNAISQNSSNWLTQQTKVGPKILKVLQRQTKTSKSHKNIQTDVSIAFSYIYSDW